MIIDSNIEKYFKSNNIKPNYILELVPLLRELLISARKKNLLNNLISFDWQLAFIERENERTSTSYNKMDKVEVGVKIKSYDSNLEEFRDDVVKMGYAEFYEIFQKMKKIDAQLKLFKN